MFLKLDLVNNLFLLPIFEPRSIETLKWVGKFLLAMLIKTFHVSFFKQCGDKISNF